LTLLAHLPVAICFRSAHSWLSSPTVARVIFHVDMDAFFASIEQRDEPSYRGRPLIVGSPPDARGVVCAASYEARQFGVRSAMPSRTAGKLCPDGIYVRPRMEVYRTESRAIMEILRSADALVEKVSVDEAYLDLSEHHPGDDADAALQAALPTARRLKERILSERGLTASIGVASNKFLAKLGSDYQKPNGLTLIPEREKVSFLRPLKVGAIHGVGPVTARTLEEADLLTIGDLQDTRVDLQRLVGSFAARLKQLAFGEDHRPVEIGDSRKSISSEHTFREDTQDRRILRAALRELAEDVAQTLEKEAVGALTVQVKVRYSDFRTLTRQIRLEEPLTESAEIYRLACFLLARDRLVTGPLRLLGIGVSTLVGPSAQLRLAI
jgi:DNA polymerase IV